MKYLNYIFLLLILCVCSCVVPVDSKNVSDRIMITDENGVILGGKDDWCFDRIQTSQITTQFKPAFPNPVQNNQVQINFEIGNTTDVLIYFEPRTVIFSHSLSPGSYFLRLETNTLGYKDEVKILKMVTSDGFKCEGSIQF